MRNTIPIWCSVMSAIAALDGSDTDTVEEVASAVTFHDLPSTPPAQSERMRSHVIPALIASVPPAIKAVIRGRLGVAGTRKPLGAFFLLVAPASFLQLTPSYPHPFASFNFPLGSAGLDPPG